MDGKIEETTGEELSGRNGKMNGSTNGLNGTSVPKATNGMNGSNGLNGKNEPNGTNRGALPQAVLMTQQSTVALRKQQAVCVRRAYKMYGSKATPNIILDGLNMTVPKGAIYGLLGSSGCGKTTLLSCIVGRRRLNSGEIWVLGGRPGSRGSGVPGPRIGYMPQEVALYGEFTLKESLKYFGMIAGLNAQQIEDRTDYLLKLLQLPDENRFVKNLSGGQQRRMSLAAALLHEPELLILDEPTVGVDPIIRQNVWDHLVEITKNGNTTVIITTHYIDETRQANIIGLLRGGRMLAEQSPDHLLREHNAESLEEVFLKLAVYQNMGKRRRSSIAHEITERIESTAVANPALDISDEGPCEISGEFGDNISMASRALETVTAELPAPPIPVEEEEHPMDCAEQISSVVSAHRMKALMWKNYLWMWRNVGVMLFIIGLPVMQIVIFCVSIGHRPVDLKLAVANDELDSDMLRMQECPVVHGCNYTYLSCRYLELLKNKSIIIELFETEEEANNAVRRGKAWAAMKFASNYSDSLIERTNSGQYAEDPTIEASEVSVRLDMSNKQISTLLYRDIQFTFFDFVEDILTDCEINPKVGRVPIDWKPPVYGDQDPNFRDFAAPGVILTIIFFVSVASTSGAMLIERNEGMLERCLVAGITSTEILFSQVFTQFTLMISQTFLVIIFSFFIFDITIRGDLGLVVLLCMLNGLCGMSFGFVISCAVHTERTATYIALGSFIPIITLCGIIWPIEGMYHLLQIAAFFLPLTKSTESMRSILQRGWSISQPTVYNGFISLTIWVIVFLVFSILFLKFRKG